MDTCWLRVSYCSFQKDILANFPKHTVPSFWRMFECQRSRPSSYRHDSSDGLISWLGDHFGNCVHRERYYRSCCWTIWPTNGGFTVENIQVLKKLILKKGSLCLQVLGPKAGLAMFSLNIFAQFFTGEGSVTLSNCRISDVVFKTRQMTNPLC